MRQLIIVLAVSLMLLSACKNSEKTNQKNGNVITTDITNFWNAYDQIIKTQDSVLQYKYLDSLYLDKGTAGLEGMIKARSYTAEEYINAINNYPEFWNSIRENTLQADNVSSQLQDGI